MALKKPSDFFREDDKSDDTIHELVKRPELQSFSEAFNAYKNNLDKLDNLTGFITSITSYAIFPLASFIITLSSSQRLLFVIFYKSIFKHFRKFGC